MIAKTPLPPYYAVIFTSVVNKNMDGYIEMALKMEELAKTQPGFLGLESARDNLGISVSYWEDQQAIKNWKENLEHRFAQEKGKNQWYKSYKTRVAKVERDYGFENKMP